MALDAGVTAGSHGGDVVKGIMGFFTACIIAGFVLAAVEDRWIRGECYEELSGAGGHAARDSVGWR